MVLLRCFTTLKPKVAVYWWDVFQANFVFTHFCLLSAIISQHDTKVKLFFTIILNIVEFQLIKYQMNIFSRLCWRTVSITLTGCTICFNNIIKWWVLFIPYSYWITLTIFLSTTEKVSTTRFQTYGALSLFEKIWAE